MVYLLFLWANVTILVILLTGFVSFTTAAIFEILFLLSIVFIFWWKISFKELLILVLYNLLLFVLMFFSWAWKNYNFLSKYIQIPKEKVVFWKWQIQDSLGPWKYVFVHSGAEFILYSKQKYKVWDRILVLAKYVPTYYRYPNANFFPLQDFSYNFYQRYHWWLFLKGFYWILYEQASIYLDSFQKNLNFISKLKQYIKNQIISYYGENKVAWLILWMTIGDKSLIPKQDYENFIKSWLVHIIAVSGANIMIIVVFLSFVLFFVPFYLRLAIILVVITIYAFVCGLDSSVFRALIMGGLALIALFFWKDIWIFKLFLIAWILMLVVNPYFLLYDLGFLLSFAALFGIIVFSQIWEKWDYKYSLKTRFYWSSYIFSKYILPTIGAGLGVIPVLILWADGYNLANVFANFAIVFIVPLVMLLGLVTSVVHIDLLKNIEIALIKYIYKVNEHFATSGYVLQFDSFWLKLVLATLIYTLLIWWFIYFIKYK